MKRIYTALCAAVLATGLSLSAQTAGQDMKAAGSDIKEGAKKTGTATKHAAKGVAKGTKKGVHKTASATAHGAEKLKEKTQ